MDPCSSQRVNRRRGKPSSINTERENNTRKYQFQPRGYILTKQIDIN
jgi:hypothetical protein